MKKAAINTQVVFFILMSIFMVGIILFGIQKLTDVEELLSEEEELELQKNIQEDFAFCENPLNRDAFKKIQIESSTFNSVCVYSGSSYDSSYGELASQLELLGEGGENIALVQIFFIEHEDGTRSISSYDIRGSFFAEHTFETSRCFTDFENEGVVTINLTC
jgi:hypothetical protein